MRKFYHDMKWFLRPVGIALAIGLLLAIFSAANGNAQTYTQINTTNMGYLDIDSVDGTYASKRDSTSASTYSPSTLRLGQSIVGGKYRVYRSFITLPVPSMTAISACSLYVYGSLDNSNIDFDVDIVTAPDYATLDKTDYPKFDGHTVGGIDTGAILNNIWNSSSYSSAWNCFVLTTAARDSILAHSGGNLCFTIISDNDYDNTAPSTQTEYVTFAVSTTVPYFAMSYTPISGYSGTISGVTNPAAVNGINKSGIKDIR